MHKNKILVFVFLMISLLWFSGCATIFTGSRQSIRVGSDPSSAKIYINGMPQGSTNSSVLLSKGENHEIILKKEGYHDFRYLLTNRKLHWTVWLNIFSFYIGWLVDSYTGAAEIYTDPTVEGVLVPLAPYVSGSKTIGFQSILYDNILDKTGTRTSKNRIEGAVFRDEITLNQANLNRLLMNELRFTGFSITENNPEVTLSGTITSIRHNVHEVKKGHFSTDSELTIQWEVSDQQSAFTASTSGRGVWQAKGTYSIELAIQEAFRRLLLQDEFYGFVEATQKP